MRTPDTGVDVGADTGDDIGADTGTAGGGTVVAVETTSGVGIAGDRRLTGGGTVRSESAERVFEFTVDSDSDPDTGPLAGAGVVGDPGGVKAFERRLQIELEDADRAHAGEPAVDAIARIAGRVASEAGVAAAVAARDEEGVPRLRRIDRDGSILTTTAVALGSGAEIALGLLESAELAEQADEITVVASFLRETLETVAVRDPLTGDAIDVWTLSASAEGGSTGRDG